MVVITSIYLVERKPNGISAVSLIPYRPLTLSSKMEMSYIFSVFVLAPLLMLLGLGSLFPTSRLTGQLFYDSRLGIQRSILKSMLGSQSYGESRQSNSIRKSSAARRRACHLQRRDHSVGSRKTWEHVGRI